MALVPKTILSALFFPIFLSSTAVWADLSPAIRSKLEAQWSRYEKAREALIARHPDPKAETVSLIPREDWETMIEAPAGQELSAAELESLRRDQGLRIARAKARARAESVIDLDRIRGLGPKEAVEQAREFCAALPKGGMLHVHPSGTLDRETVSSLLTQVDPAIPFQELASELSATGETPHLHPEELAWLRSQAAEGRYSQLSPEGRARFADLFFLPPGTHPFWRFDAAFYFMPYALNSGAPDYAANLTRAYRDFGARAVREGLIYVEFTTGVSSSSIALLERIAEELRSDLGLEVRFNRSFGRLSPPETQAKQAADLLERVASPLVVGIDLLGNETLTPALKHGQIPYGKVLAAVRAGKSALQLTQHAGELGDARNPRDALIFGAKRLGHAVKLRDDAVALEYAARNGTGIEACLVSNHRLQAHGDFATHPYLDYLRLGLGVSLATDDEGILETDINRECETAVLETDVTYAELRSMAFHSIDAAFAQEPLKLRLREKLEARFAEFERKRAPLPN